MRCVIHEMCEDVKVSINYRPKLLMAVGAKFSEPPRPAHPCELCWNHFWARRGPAKDEAC